MILLVPRDVINRGLLVKDGMGNTKRVDYGWFKLVVPNIT